MEQRLSVSKIAWRPRFSIEAFFDRIPPGARDAIRAATPRNFGESLTEIIRQVNRWARG
jgi:hypothetical protein